MKIAISGKGGSGKTTIAATLARLFARRGCDTLAIDADPSCNLGFTLGIPSQEMLRVSNVPSTVIQETVGFSKEGGPSLALPLNQILDRYGVRAPEGVGLLVMGGIDHADAG